MQADTVYRRGGRTGYAPYPAPEDGPSADTAPVAGPGIDAPLMRTVPTIYDVLRTTRLYPDARLSTSGYAQPGYSGTARPAMSSWW